MCASVPAMALTSMPPCSTVSISFPLPSLFFYLKELKPEELFYYFSFLLSSDDAHTEQIRDHFLSCLEALQFHANCLCCRCLCSVFSFLSCGEICEWLTTSAFPVCNPGCAYLCLGTAEGTHETAEYIPGEISGMKHRRTDIFASSSHCPEEQQVLLDTRVPGHVVTLVPHCLPGLHLQ